VCASERESERDSVWERERESVWVREKERDRVSEREREREQKEFWECRKILLQFSATKAKGDVWSLHKSTAVCYFFLSRVC
jgi:hypothetical protein